MLGVVVEEGVACTRAVGGPEDLDTRERVRHVLDDGVLVHTLSIKAIPRRRHGSQPAGSAPKCITPTVGVQHPSESPAWFDSSSRITYNVSEVVLGGEPGLPCTRNAHSGAEFPPEVSTPAGSKG